MYQKLYGLTPEQQAKLDSLPAEDKGNYARWAAKQNEATAIEALKRSTSEGLITTAKNQYNAFDLKVADLLRNKKPSSILVPVTIAAIIAGVIIAKKKKKRSR